MKVNFSTDFGVVLSLFEKNIFSSNLTKVKGLQKSMSTNTWKNFPKSVTENSKKYKKINKLLKSIKVK